MDVKEHPAAQKLAHSYDDITESTGLSRAFLKREVKRGALSVTKFGRRVLVLDAELRRYLNAGSPGLRGGQADAA